VILTVAGACVMYGVLMAVGSQSALLNIQAIPSYCSTYYVNLSIFLAFALPYPDMEVLLYVFIPIRMKWMGWRYGAFLIYQFYKTPLWSGRILMIISLLNFLIYFLATKNMRSLSPQEFRRRAEFRKNGGVKSQKRRDVSKTSRGVHWNRTAEGGRRTGMAEQAESRRPSEGFKKIVPGGARHVCAICGRTELTNPELEFRYCSRCEGNYEYCQDHLFTHVHVKNGSKPHLAEEEKQ
jgi:hypothetical protein